MNSLKNNLQQCKDLIETKLTWGASENWQNQDFENLSQKIFEDTKILVSSSTLKRIWGKVKYDSVPKLHTLNALSIFVGFGSWREFENQYLEKVNSVVEEQIIKEPKTITSPKPNFKKWVLVLMAIVIVGITVYVLTLKTLKFSQIVFTSKLIIDGVPTTVIFNYNAKNSNADSIFIQQSWDKNQRARVEKSGNTFTCTYYEPGYHKAKLILNDSIVKQHDLLIKTQGWIATIDKNPIPIFLDLGRRKLPLSISQKDFQSKSINFAKDLPWVSFFNVSDSLRVPANSFEMKTRLKNTFSEGDGVCQNSTVTLMAQNSTIHIPLSIKGCIGELNLVIGNQIINGKTNNLATFGVDFADFVNLKCIVKNGLIVIFANEKTIYSATYAQNLGDIVGCRISFKGTGLLENFSLKRI
ncbi:MAG: hypothetical protein V4683_15820 [Bacteroidota bacterium]